MVILLASVLHLHRALKLDTEKVCSGVRASLIIKHVKKSQYYSYY